MRAQSSALRRTGCDAAGCSDKRGRARVIPRRIGGENPCVAKSIVCAEKSIPATKNGAGAFDRSATIFASDGPSRRSVEQPVREGGVLIEIQRQQASRFANEAVSPRDRTIARAIDVEPKHAIVQTLPEPLLFATIGDVAVALDEPAEATDDYRRKSLQSLEGFLGRLAAPSSKQREPQDGGPSRKPARSVEADSGRIAYRKRAARTDRRSSWSRKSLRYSAPRGNALNPLEKN